MEHSDDVGKAGDLANRFETAGAALLAVLRRPETVERLRSAPGETEWSALETLGHVVEMIPYWLNHCRTLIAASGEPPAFGRTLESPERLAAVEEVEKLGPERLIELLEAEVEDASRAMRGMSAAWPQRCTGSTQRVRGPVRSRHRSGSRSRSSSPTSANAGSAPARRTADAVGEQELAAVTTESPRPIPSAARATWSAAVPEATATQWRAPTNPANSDSKASVSGPRMRRPDRRTRRTADRTSSSISGSERR